MQVCKTDEESGKDGQLHLVVVHAMKMFIPCTNIFHFERSRLWHKVSGVERGGLTWDLAVPQEIRFALPCFQNFCLEAETFLQWYCCLKPRTQGKHGQFP